MEGLCSPRPSEGGFAPFQALFKVLKPQQNLEWPRVLFSRSLQWSRGALKKMGGASCLFSRERRRGCREWRNVSILNKVARDSLLRSEEAAVWLLRKGSSRQRAQQVQRAWGQEPWGQCLKPKRQCPKF